MFLSQIDLRVHCHSGVMQSIEPDLEIPGPALRIVPE